MIEDNFTSHDSIEETYVHHVVDTFLKTYATLLLLIGIPGNVISGIIMGGNKGNRLTTRILIIILSVADTAVLLVALLRYWTMRVLDWDPRLTHYAVCKIHMFGVAFSTDFAVGALCAIAVERLLVVAFPHKANSIVSVKSVLCGMSSFGLVIVIKNLLHFWMMGYTENSDTGKPRCVPLKSYEYLFKLFSKLDLISFAVLPYVILFSSNVYIFWKLRSQRALLHRTKLKLPATTGRKLSDSNADVCVEVNNRNTMLNNEERQKRKKRRPDGVIKLLTALTVIHVCCTLPGTVFTFVTTYTDKLVNSLDPDTTELIKSGLVMLIFTNNATNFFGYYVSCSSFRHSFSALFRCCTRARRARESTIWD